MSTRAQSTNKDQPSGESAVIYIREVGVFGILRDRQLSRGPSHVPAADDHVLELIITCEEGHLVGNWPVV